MRIFSYIGEIFCSGNVASFARWATVPTIATGCWAVVHVVRSTHTLPDALALAALAAWMTAPYGIGKLAGAYTTSKTPAASA
jgi:hypothetical protein